MSDFDDEFLKDFEDNDDGREEDEDDDNSEDNNNDPEDVGADGAVDVDTLGDSGKPKAPLRNDEEYLRLLEKISIHTEESFGGQRIEQVIEECNRAVSKISSEIAVWHRRASRLYHPAFPELEKLVPEPVDFAKVILAYDHSDDADLSTLVPAATVMVIKVSKSVHVNSISSFPFPNDLNEALSAAREILALDHDRSLFIAFLEAQMRSYAPNLFELVGSRTAALLVGIAGGLSELYRIPSNDLQVLGRSRATRADTGVVHGNNAALHKHAGVLSSCPLVLSAPVHLRRKALRVLAGRVALAARVDELGRDKSSGRTWRDEIAKKIELWQEPGPSRVDKALPVPDAARPKRRGGRRARKLKEKLGMTSMRALANREKFGEASQDVEYSVAAMGDDLGMLTQGANGRVRSTQTKNNNQYAAQASKRLKGINAGGGKNISGFSSLAFTPVQGMELAPVAPARPKPPVPLFSKPNGS